MSLPGTYGYSFWGSGRSASFERAVRMSIGIGKTIVELFAEPISSSVWR